MLSTTLCKGIITKYEGEVLSSSIASLEEELRTLISENGEFMRYANPVMMLLKKNSTEDILTEAVTDEQRLLELGEISRKLSIETLIVHDIRMWDDVSKIDLTLSASRKCVALRVFDTEDVRINSVRMMNFLCELLQKHSSIKLIKPGISCPIELSYYIILCKCDHATGAACTDTCNTLGSYVDFLYAIYEYAIYIVNVVTNMQYDLKYDDVLDMQCSYSDLYKQFINKLNNIIKSLHVPPTQ